MSYLLWDPPCVHPANGEDIRTIYNKWKNLLIVEIEEHNKRWKWVRHMHHANTTIWMKFAMTSGSSD